jgi:transcriptional regulator with XRE-family HTH domain
MTENNTSERNRFDTGSEIRRIRGNRSQQEFADLLGVGRNTIQRYESNDRAPDTEFLLKLNLIFGVDPSRVVLGRESGQLDSVRERGLVRDFRAASPEDQQMIERVAKLAAQVASGSKSKLGG